MEELEVILEDEETLEVDLENDVINYGTSDYTKLQNKPSINNVELIGNKTAKDLNLQEEVQALTNLEIEEILNL